MPVETKEQLAARARAYRKTEKYKAWERQYESRKKHLRRARRMRDRHCMFCDVLMKSETVKLKQSRYCQDCRKDPKVKAYLRNVYIRRWRQKKKGPPQEPIVFRRVVYTGVGRPPVKSIIKVNEN